MTHRGVSPRTRFRSIFVGTRSVGTPPFARSETRRGGRPPGPPTTAAETEPAAHVPAEMRRRRRPEAGAGTDRGA